MITKFDKEHWNIILNGIFCVSLLIKTYKNQRSKIENIFFQYANIQIL